MFESDFLNLAAALEEGVEYSKSSWRLFGLPLFFHTGSLAYHQPYFAVLVVVCHRDTSPQYSANYKAFYVAVVVPLLITSSLDHPNYSSVNTSP
jgi:hypothetical protein